MRCGFLIVGISVPCTSALYRSSALIWSTKVLEHHHVRYTLCAVLIGINGAILRRSMHESLQHDGGATCPALSSYLFEDGGKYFAHRGESPERSPGVFLGWSY